MYKKGIEWGLRDELALEARKQDGCFVCMTHGFQTMDDIFARGLWHVRVTDCATEARESTTEESEHPATAAGVGVSKLDSHDRSFLYTQYLLKIVFQILGCKSQHAFRLAGTVFGWLEELTLTSQENRQRLLSKIMVPYGSATVLEVRHGKLHRIHKRIGRTTFPAMLDSDDRFWSEAYASEGDCSSAYASRVQPFGQQTDSDDISKTRAEIIITDTIVPGNLDSIDEMVLKRSRSATGLSQSALMDDSKSTNWDSDCAIDVPLPADGVSAPQQTPHAAGPSLKRGLSRRALIRHKTVQIARPGFYNMLANALYRLGYFNRRRDLQLACQLAEGAHSYVILLGGTSGCGKSTLSSLLASQLGITTVLSTDSIRHLLRNYQTKEDNPILYASTYHAGDFLPEHVEPHKHTKTERVLMGYQLQCELVSPFVKRIISSAVERKESIIIEGVHLHMEFVKELCREFSNCIPFLVHISNKTKHKERLAVRAKYMTVDPNANRYIQHFAGIRTINDCLCTLADMYGIPKIDNTNVDRSVAAVVSSVFATLRRLYGWSPGVRKPLWREKKNRFKFPSSNQPLITSKTMLSIIRRKQYEALSLVDVPCTSTSIKSDSRQFRRGLSSPVRRPLPDNGKRLARVVVHIKDASVSDTPGIADGHEDSSEGEADDEQEEGDDDDFETDGFDVTISHDVSNGRLNASRVSNDLIPKSPLTPITPKSNRPLTSDDDFIGSVVSSSHITDSRIGGTDVEYELRLSHASDGTDLERSYALRSPLAGEKSKGNDSSDESGYSANDGSEQASVARKAVRSKHHRHRSSSASSTQSASNRIDKPMDDTAQRRRRPRNREEERRRFFIGSDDASPSSSEDDSAAE